MRTKRLAWLSCLVALSILTASGRTLADETRRVYAVIVLDTLAHKAANADLADISASLKIDGPNIVSLLEEGLGEHVLEPKKPKILEGEQANWKALETYLASIRPTKNDTLFCFIGCHGWTVGQSGDEHELHLCGTGRAIGKKRSLLRSLLKDKGSRLTVLITDACSVYSPQALAGRDPNKRLPIARSPAPHKKVFPAYQRLFLEASGVVDINAALEGSVAWGDEGGGIFTRSLREALHETRNEGAITWRGFHNHLKVTTEKHFESWCEELIQDLEKRGIEKLSGEDKGVYEELRDLKKKKKYQTPQAYYLGQGGSLGLTLREGDEGMEVDEMPLDSPVRRAGIKVGECILKANCEQVQSRYEWIRVIQKELDAGRTEFVFLVRSGNGRKRSVKVSLNP